MKVKPIPEGYTSLTPFIVVHPAAAAIDFYCEVFGATLVSRMDGENGHIHHAELQFPTGRLQLSDPAPAFALVPPPEGDAVSSSLCFYCVDVDAVVAKAEAAGAIVREPVSTFVTGDRFGSIRDPFGQRWSIMTRVEDLTPEEQNRRLADWGAKNLG